MNLGEFVERRAVEIAQGALDEIRGGNLRTLGEVEEYVNQGLGQTADDLLALASGTSSPLVQSMMASMQPAIMASLQAYTPMFAAVSGGMLALAVLLGVWVAKPDTFERWFS
jgi:hypothetical protein